MTPYSKVYDAFLVTITSDEWETWEDWEREKDWQQLMLGALPWFKFPRVSLTMGDDGFVNDLTNNEVQVIAAFMKVVWFDRVVDSWENLQPLYSERDFSPARMISEYRQKQIDQLTKAKKLEATYYRSINEKSYDFKKLAGGR